MNPPLGILSNLVVFLFLSATVGFEAAGFFLVSAFFLVAGYFLIAFDLRFLGSTALLTGSASIFSGLAT